MNIDFNKIEPGVEGKSAYQIAVDNGFQGTEADWEAYLEDQEVRLQSKDYTITSNSTTVISPDQGFDGIYAGNITVDVPERVPVIEDKSVSISDNGQTVVEKTTGTDGMGKVTVNVEVPEKAIEPEKSVTIEKPGVIMVRPSPGYDGMQEVLLNVSVPEKNLQDKTLPEITVNGPQTITPDAGFDGMTSVGFTVNVSGGGDKPVSGGLDYSATKYSTEDQAKADQAMIDYNQPTIALTAEVEEKWDPAHPWPVIPVSIGWDPEIGLSFYDKTYENGDVTEDLFFGPKLDTSNLESFHFPDPQHPEDEYMGKGLFEELGKMIYMPEIDMSKATDISNVFINNYLLRNLPKSLANAKITKADKAFGACCMVTDFPQMDTSRCTSMESMMAIDPYGTSSLAKVNPKPISTQLNFDMSSCVNAARLFYRRKFYGQNIPTFSNIKVLEDASYMFNSTDITSFDFDTQFNFSNLALPEGKYLNLYQFFTGCKNLERVDNFDVSKSEQFQFLFDDCDAIRHISVKGGLNPNVDWSSQLEGGATWGRFDNMIYTNEPGEFIYYLPGNYKPMIDAVKTLAPNFKCIPIGEAEFKVRVLKDGVWLEGEQPTLTLNGQALIYAGQGLYTMKYTFTEDNYQAFDWNVMLDGVALGEAAPGEEITLMTGTIPMSKEKVEGQFPMFSYLYPYGRRWEWDTEKNGYIANGTLDPKVLPYGVGYTYDPMFIEKGGLMQIVISDRETGQTYSLDIDKDSPATGELYIDAPDGFTTNNYGRYEINVTSPGHIWFTYFYKNTIVLPDYPDGGGRPPVPTPGEIRPEWMTIYDYDGYGNLEKRPMMGEGENIYTSNTGYAFKENGSMIFSNTSEFGETYGFADNVTKLEYGKTYQLTNINPRPMVVSRGEMNPMGTFNSATHTFTVGPDPMGQGGGEIEL